MSFHKEDYLAALAKANQAISEHPQIVGAVLLVIVAFALGYCTHG